MYFNFYSVIYSQNSHQHVSADILAIHRVIILNKSTKIQI